MEARAEPSAKTQYLFTHLRLLAKQRQLLEHSMKLLLILVTLFTTLASITATNGQVAESIASGDFIEKQKSISGDWSIQRDGEQLSIVFADNFKSKSGPDLKIFLSPIALSKVTGKTATKGSVLIAELKRTKGTQKYPIPSDIDLIQYKSLLIHCEKYAILWGGGEL